MLGCTAELVNVSYLDSYLQAEHDPGMAKTLTAQPDSTAAKVRFAADKQKQTKGLVEGIWWWWRWCRNGKTPEQPVSFKTWMHLGHTV